MTEQIAKCLTLGMQQNPQMFNMGDRTDPSTFCTFTVTQSVAMNLL